jgi:uncharacterized protein
MEEGTPVSNPYGYGGQQPPPGVLPPPQPAPWQPQGPPAQYQGQHQGQYQGQYPAQWAQPYYGGGQFNGFRPPPRKSPVLKFLIFGVSTLVVVLMGLILAIALAGGESGEPTSRRSPGGSSGPSIVPTATTSPEKGTAEDMMLNNQVYAAGGLGELNCPAERLGDGSLAAQKRYYEKLFSCLKQGWDPALKKAGFTPQEPGLVVFDKPVETPCGNFKPKSGRVLAFFCYGNKVMYTDVLQMNSAFGPKEDLAYLMTLAHEYGHYIQGESGLFYARAVYIQEHPEQKLDNSRRNELQASCFGGVFSKAIAASYPLGNRMDEFQYQASNSFGDSPDTPENERTHGQATSQGFWIMNGLNIGETKACNTFAAPSDLVR